MPSPDSTPTTTQKKTPPKEPKKTPSLTFKCSTDKDGKLEVTIVSCENLPDLDGAFNKTDAYVVVKVGKEKKNTKAVSSLNPKFNENTNSTLLFDVRAIVE